MDQDSGSNVSSGNSENTQSSGSTSESASASSSAPSAKGLSGYLVALGAGGMACRSGSTDYTNYSAAEGASEGDSCTVTGDNEE